MTATVDPERMVFRPEFAQRLKLANVRSLAQVKDLPPPDGSALVDGHWRIYWLEATVDAFVSGRTRAGQSWRRGRLGGWS